jgi:hypothetical protein
MKFRIFLMLVFIVLSSCNDETLAPTRPIDDMTDLDAMLNQSGMFMNGPYGAVTGTAIIFKNKDNTFDLKLEDFNTSNGPDLYVYLSKEAMPITFISLGKLKSTNGNQVYEVPGTADFSEYKYVCIHCKAYNHLFGYALLN